MKSVTIRLLTSGFLALTFMAPLQAFEFGPGEWVDLTHDFANGIPSFPRGKTYQHEEAFVGETRGGYYMATYNYAASEHVGTHLDAPIHFHKEGKSIEQLPFQQLMGDVIVVDIKAAVAANMNYLATVKDLADWEDRHGRIPDDAIVMFNTGLANVWPDATRYLGTDLKGNEGVAAMKNPGIHKDAAAFLAKQRRIKAVGIDSISFDNSLQSDRMAHRILFAHDIPGVENVANLDILPPTGAYLIGLPMKIKGGSAAPIRLIAFIPEQAGAN